MTPADTTAPAAEPAPAAAPPLDARAKRRAREAARRARLEAARQRRADRAAAKQAATEDGSADEAPAEETAAPERTDDDRRRDLAVMLQGVWLIFQGAAALFGYRLADLTASEASEDAPAWVPVARRYRSLDVLATWVAAPVRLIRRVRGKLAKRDATPPEEKRA